MLVTISIFVTNPLLFSQSSREYTLYFGINHLTYKFCTLVTKECSSLVCGSTQVKV
jgi:hypothetical protein